MAERRMRLKLGLFVAGSLAALAGLVVMFGGAPTLWSTTDKYTLVFPEAPGITPGTPIRKSGVRIGEVSSIDLNADSGQVLVRITVDPKYRPRTGEDAVITRGILNGDTAIEFVPHLGPDGQPIGRGEAYEIGAEIAGVPPITPRSLLTPASGILASAQISLDRISASFEKLEKVAPKLELAADEIALFMRDARMMLPELRKTLERVQMLIGAFDPADPDPNTIRAAVGELRALLKAIRPAVDHAREMIKRLEPEVVGAARATRKTFETLQVTADSLNKVLSPENVKQIDELLKNMNLMVFNILKIAGGLSTLLDEAQQTVKTVNRQIEAAGGVISDVRAITKPLAERSDQLVRDVAESAAQLNMVLRDVRDVIRVFAREDGTLHQLMTDPNLYKNLDAAALALAKVLTRADVIAKDLEVFADKVARRPELIGVGGALRPSSGLKDSPFDSKMPCYRPEWPPSIPAARSGPPWLQPPDAATGPPPPIQGLPPR